MMSISLAASCFRMANICSCLRMVEAFSTACSSAKARSSVGDLDLRSWSFISRIWGIPKGRPAGFEKWAAPGRGREVAGLAREIRLPDRVSGPLNRKLGYIRLRFTRVMPKYEIGVVFARGRSVAPSGCRQLPLRPNLQQSEWLDNNENHDSDHQEGRNFVDNTVKLA